MAAVIGALRVDLGLNSAEFSSGLKKASNGLGNFAKTAGIGLAAVATAAAAAGVALAFAVKGAIDNADHMGELAASVGVSVEALTRLNYAASFSTDGTETLSNGLRKLSQNMLAVAQGGAGPAATAFTALGVSVTNANGSLRASDQVLIDVADKFAGMEDGATKTAMAVQLFGKSGAELIPFLNEGRSGIAALTAEADTLGITISGETSTAAGDFNDALDRMRAGLGGMVNKIMVAALPSLNSLVDTVSSPAFLAAMADFATACIKTANAIAQVFIGAHKAFQDFMAYIRNEDIGTAQYAPGETGYSTFKNTEAGRATDSSINRQLEWMQSGKGKPNAGDLYAGFGFTEDGTLKIQETAVALSQVATVLNDVSGAGAGANAVMEEGKAVFDATRTPAEAYGIQVARLSELLKQGVIDQDTYNRAVLDAQDALNKADQAGQDLASSLADGLANVFSSVVDGSKSAVDAVGDLLKSLGQLLIHKAFESLISSIFPGGFSLPGFASGTNFAPGGAALVGENGPEIVNLPRGSQVIPNHELPTANGTSRVRVELGAGLVAQILDRAAAQSVEVVKSYDSNLGSIVSEKKRRATNGFGSL